MTRRKGNLAQATRNTTAKDAMFDCNFVGQGREPSGTFVPSLAFYDRCPSNGDTRMRLSRLALASVLLSGWTGGATASPLIPTLAGISFQSHSDIEAARWRHRNRGYSWGDRGDGDRYAIDGSARSFNSENRSTTPEVVPPDLGRRYHRGRFWGARRDANRDETSDVALSLNGANRFAPSEVVRPDPRRRRGWVDPPPAQ